MKQLRFTSSKPMGMFSMLTEDPEMLVTPAKIGAFIEDKVKGTGAYIHNDAEELAGFDIPHFIDGNLGQLDLPVEEQDILMVLPTGEYPCKAELCEDHGDIGKYYLTLKK